MVKVRGLRRNRLAAVMLAALVFFLFFVGAVVVVTVLNPPVLHGVNTQLTGTFTVMYKETVITSGESPETKYYFINEAAEQIQVWEDVYNRYSVGDVFPYSQRAIV